MLVSVPLQTASTNCPAFVADKCAEMRAKIKSCKMWLRGHPGAYRETAGPARDGTPTTSRLDIDVPDRSWV